MAEELRPQSLFEGKLMSIPQDRDAGQHHLESRITNVLTTNLSWSQAHDRDVSVLTVTSRGTKSQNL
jgi:hypothetical protein